MSSTCSMCHQQPQLCARRGSTARLHVTRPEGAQALSAPVAAAMLGCQRAGRQQVADHTLVCVVGDHGAGWLTAHRPAARSACTQQGSRGAQGLSPSVAVDVIGIPARRACSRRRLTRSSASSVTVGAWWSDRSRPASTARRHPSSSFQPSPTGMLSGFRSGRLLAAIQHGCRNGSLASCLRTATPRGAYRSARDERFTMVRGAANPAPRHP